MVCLFMGLLGLLSFLCRFFVGVSCRERLCYDRMSLMSGSPLVSWSYGFVGFHGEVIMAFVRSFIN
jgi:hypothetical protein